MTLPVLGWRIGSWFLQCILARVNKFSIYGFGLYLFSTKLIIIIIKVLIIILLPFHVGLVEFLFIFLFLSPSLICLILCFH